MIVVRVFARVTLTKILASLRHRPRVVSAVSALETFQGFAGREDFWIIAAIMERR
jgi:hypothetical protein